MGYTLVVLPPAVAKIREYCGKTSCRIQNLHWLQLVHNFVPSDSKIKHKISNNVDSRVRPARKCGGRHKCSYKNYHQLQAEFPRFRTRARHMKYGYVNAKLALKKVHKIWGKKKEKVHWESINMNFLYQYYLHISKRIHTCIDFRRAVLVPVCATSLKKF